MICELCKKEHNGTYGSGRFCSISCARSFSTSDNRKLINKKISDKLKGKKCVKGGIIEVNHGPRDKLTNRLIYSKNCKYCQEKFTTIYKKIEYCSISCSNKSRRINDDDFEIYRQKCLFTFNVYDYPKLFDLSLIEKYGWYKAKNKGNNLNGISRDHKISIVEGFKNNIPPHIISHPLNCELMRHSKNNKKNTKCSITINELMKRIGTLEWKQNK